MTQARHHNHPTSGPEPTADLWRVAQKLVWWKPPGEALGDPIRFVAQVMNLGTWTDVCTVRDHYGEAIFAAVLDQPPPGVFTVRRWNYWHVRLGRQPVPPLPKRFAA